MDYDWATGNNYGRKAAAFLTWCNWHQVKLGTGINKWVTIRRQLGITIKYGREEAAIIWNWATGINKWVTIGQLDKHNGM